MVNRKLATAFLSKAMQKILEELDKDGFLSKDREIFERLYSQVREHCEKMGDAENRQKILIRLYDSFFKIALPKTSEKLGIVYTPVEVVDFILNSVNDVLQKNFGKTLSDKNVHILDPFTGTGTFIVRLIQSGLISKKDLLRKFSCELHANEIVLLAYYIAAINIENAFNADSKNYFPFRGICFADTFEMYERDNVTILENMLEKNSERVEKQISENIEVIIGNPPYSVGQKSANDNNQNNFYENLSNRIAETYAKNTSTTLKARIYDSYIKAFRWASDRISEGIIGFVTNAGWIDGAAMDGLRKNFSEEFSEIFIFNLRGNARTQGEIRKKESGNIFGSGSRAPIAITILVKKYSHNGHAKIFYCDIGDYLTREQKLEKFSAIKTVLNENFQLITPNEKFDWINQRGNLFEKYILLGDNDSKETFFENFSNGLQSNRDAWVYNFSRKNLFKNVCKYLNYNGEAEFNFEKKYFVRATKKKSAYTKIVTIVKVPSENFIVESSYRPFCEEFLYFGEKVIHRPAKMKNFFPEKNSENILICVPGNGAKNFSVFLTKKICDLHFIGDVQCFPLYYYEREESNLFGETALRRDGVSDFIENLAREKYGLFVHLKVGEKSFCVHKSLKEEIF